MTIQLFNKSKKTISGKNKDGQEFNLAPQTAMAFDDVTGAKLKRLYKSELISPEDFMKQFDTPKAAPAPEPEVKAEPKQTPEEVAEFHRQAIASGVYNALIAKGFSPEEATAEAWPEKAAPQEVSKTVPPEEEKKDAAKPKTLAERMGLK